MKGLCLEVRNGTSAILKEDGTVVKLNKVYRVGETIEVPEKKLLDFILDSSLVTRTVAVAAAVVALFVGGGLYSYNNLLAASYLSVDVNPSLEYTLNRANKVINVKALNEDADSVVKELKESGIKNSNISKTISETARVMENEHYIADDKDNVMLIGITAGNTSSSTKITEEVQNAAKAELDGRVEVYTVVTSKAERNEAQKLGVSAGRYSTMKTIAAANGNSDEVQFSDNDIEEAMNESVAGLVKK
ncbi:MAG: hypothetical protein K6F99_10425, partial [Lachnospiraceae bacterium]|nr:hypothetical protein [Lachnospiraceae bacterium]